MAFLHRGVVVGLALFLFASAADARDYCFYSFVSSPQIVVVAQKFRPPGRGKCRAITGWEGGFYGFTFPRPVSGTACVDYAGTRMDVGITIHATYEPASGVNYSELQLYMTLPYPTLVGGTTYLRQDEPYLNGLHGAGEAGYCGYAMP